MGLTNINEVVNHHYNLDPDHQPIVFTRHSSSKCTTKLSLVALAFKLCLRKKKNVDMHVVAGHLAEQSILPINSDSLHALYKQHNAYPFCKWCTFCPFLKISETTTHSELLFYPLKECCYLEKIFWAALSVQHPYKPMSIHMLFIAESTFALNKVCLVNHAKTVTAMII